jgi:hypothetical protein
MHFVREAGLVEVAMEGLWSRTDAERFCKELNEKLLQVRQVRAKVRLLVDRRGCPVQFPAVMDILSANRSQLGPNDRLALVLDSTLSRIQQRRVTSDDNTQIFDDVGAARRWLTQAP